MPKDKKTKGFFALDVDQFFQIERRGLGIEEAVAYLALMKGTDETNVISRGGINSVTNYTGLTRSEAKRAIGNMDRIGLIEKLEVERARAKTLPRYKLPVHESPRALAPQEAAVAEQVANGKQPISKSDLNAAQRAQLKGWLEKLSTGWASVPPAQRIAYIPNMFVHMEGQASPLKRLVGYGELGPVMLAAELYHKQNLMDERGIPTSEIRQYYSSAGKELLGTSPRGYQLHTLRPGRLFKEEGEDEDILSSYDPESFQYSSQDFWRDIKALEKTHLVEWAVFSANGRPKNEDAFNRPQRPLGVLRNGKQVPNTPEAAAAFVTYYLVSMQSCTRGGYEIASLDQVILQWRNELCLFVVEETRVEHVEGVGILRLVYRADTENTAEWFRNLHREVRAALFSYNRQGTPNSIKHLIKLRNFCQIMI
uniref:hypothetical protein n=1 Tax=Paracoccus sp. T5 TaxID=3402161 RepID=UPI003AE4BCB7